jgi:DNA-binding transcriptional LysR family regulator
MNLAAIDLNLLVALDALVSEAHVGRAARRIGLSQPATSHALKRLRDLLDDPLLVRVGTRMELTPRAAQLRDSLPEALRRVQTVLIVDSFEPATSRRRFAIMMHDHIAHLIVPPLMKLLQAEAPAVTIDIAPWKSPKALGPERLRSLDLLISCSTDSIPGFQRERLFTDSEVTVIRKGHPSAGRLRQVDAFLAARHVAVVGAGQTEDPVDLWLREQQLERTITLRVPSYLQALQTVAQSDLIAFVPRRLAQSLARPLSLDIVRPPIDPGTYDEYLFHPLHAHDDPASIWLRTLTKKGATA